LSVEDVITQGALTTDATVDCGVTFPLTLSAGETLECTYTALPASPDDGVNEATAIIESLDGSPSHFSGTADLAFIENLIGYDSGTLADDRFGYSQMISGDLSVPFPESFTCPADASLYANGSYSFQEVNEATLNGNIGLSASATVDVTCTLQPLVPNKTAAGTYDRTVTWTLDKSVDVDSHTGSAGEAAGTSNWTVVADKTEVSDNYQVTGSISVYNPAAIPQAFTVSDVLNDGTVTSVTCDTDTVPAGGTVDCTYTASPADDSATLNTATVSATGNPDQTATADLAFTENLIGYDSGTLSDDNEFNPNAPTVISGDTTWTYAQTFTCSSDQADYTNGSYSFEVPNTATLNDNINLSATENVTVTCTLQPLVPTKDATASYDERHTWDVEKSVDVESQSGYPGDELEWTWTVGVSETSVDENFAVTGNISIYNPAAVAQSVTSVADALNDGTVATVECGASFPIEIAPLGTLTCTYTASPADGSATLNTATVSAAGHGDQTATADVSFVKSVIDGTAEVDDDQESDFPQTLTAGNGPWEWTETQSHTCSTSKDAYEEDGTYSDTRYNTATVEGSNGQTDSADANTTYTCEAGFMDLLKTTNGVVNPDMTWSFELYEGPDGFGTTPIGTDNTSGDADGILDFDGPALSPDLTYTVCELEIPAGYSSRWEWLVNGNPVIPYNPNADDETPEDLGNRCVDFGAGTDYPVTVGTTIHFKVDNSKPGGDPRTPGYWKNWNTCTGGGQQFTAAANGGYEEGFWLLEDVLDPSISTGIVWDDILGDSFTFTIDTCEVAVDILDKREVADPAIVADGKKKASDPLHNLATHLLAAQLNFGASACIPDFTVDPSLPDIQQVALQAETLLDQYDFDGNDHEKLNKKSDDATLANYLAALLDNYNNGMYCGSTYVPPSTP
jgi:hypothetical protein